MKYVFSLCLIVLNIVGLAQDNHVFTPSMINVGLAVKNKVAMTSVFTYRLRGEKVIDSTLVGTLRGNFDLLPNSAEFNWHEDSKLKTTMKGSNRAPEPLTMVVRYDYDDQGKQIDATEFSTDSVFLRRTHNLYDHSGRLNWILTTVRKSRAFVSKKIKYNRDGEVAREIYIDSVGMEYSHVYKYDKHARTAIVTFLNSNSERLAYAIQFGKPGQIIGKEFLLPKSPEPIHHLEQFVYSPNGMLKEWRIFHDGKLQNLHRCFYQ